MKSIVIIGAGDLAENLYYNLQKEQIKIEAFVVEKEYRKETTYLGCPLLTVEELEELSLRQEVAAYLCVGYSNMNRNRKRLYEQLRKMKIEILSYIHPQALVETEELGEGCLVFEKAYIGPYTRIGKANIFYPCSVTAHHTIMGDYNYIAISASIAGHVTIGDECFFGNNCCTKDKITVGNRVLVGAGAYLSKDIADNLVLRASEGVILENRKSSEFL